MSQRTMRGPAMPDLEAELRALAGAVDWPLTPDVAGAVRVRLADAPVPPRGRVWWPAFRMTRPLVLAIVLLLVAVAIAAAIALGLPGLRITFTGDPLPSTNLPAVSAQASAAPSGSASAIPSASAAPSASARPPGSGLGLGIPVSFEMAAQRPGQPLLVPSSPGRPPDAAFLEVVRGAPIVTLVWRAGPGLPPLAPGSDVGLLVSQFAATLDEPLMEKLLREGDTEVERLTVDGHPAFWITGVEHILWFRRTDGEVVETFVRLVGDTLALEVDGTIVRIETSGGREAAIAIAGSLQ